MRILVLEHDADAPAALLVAWAQSRGHELRVVAGRDPDGWPEIEEFDAIVSLGSEQSAVQSDVPWVAREIELLARAHQRQVPVLGICFGGQALAKALGGTVARAARREVTWRTVPSAEPELIPEGPWLFWHEDLFTLPPGARLLVRNSGRDGLVHQRIQHRAAVSSRGGHVVRRDLAERGAAEVGLIRRR